MSDPAPITSVPERLREVGMPPEELAEAEAHQPAPEPAQTPADSGTEGSSLGDS